MMFNGPSANYLQQQLIAVNSAIAPVRNRSRFDADTERQLLTETINMCTARLDAVNKETVKPQTPTPPAESGEPDAGIAQ